MLFRSVLVGLAFAASVNAQENLFIQAPQPTHKKDKTRIEVDALFSMAPPTGYLPVRVNVINQRKANGRLTFDTESSFGSGDDGSTFESEFSIESEQGTATTHDLLIPLTTELSGSGGYGGYSGYSGTSVSIQMSGSFGGNSGSISSSFSPDGPAVLMSKALHDPNASAIDAQLNSSSGGYGSYSFAARFDPKRMPEDWRAYSGYDLMILTDTDWRALPPGAKTSILQWIRLNATLAIYTTNGSSNLKSLGISDEPDSSSSGFGYGKVELISMDGAGMSLDPVKTVGRFHKRAATLVEGLNRSIREDYSSRWPLHEEFGKQTFDYGIFVAVLIIFAVLVGPINLFVFAKSGKRHKLFITTPIISLGTSAILIALILMRDGVGGRGSRIALIEIRPESGENRSYITQEQITRTGVLLGSGFTLEESAAITSVPISDSPWARLTPSTYGGGMRYNGEFGEDGMKVTGDWFQSRSEQGQLIRAVVPTRGRIEIKGSAGPPSFVSSFEFPLERLYYADRSGGWWVVTGLEAGQAQKGTSISQGEYNAAISDEAIRLADRQRNALNRAANRTDSFVAITTEAPAIETFDSIRWGDTRTILTGPAIR